MTNWIPRLQERNAPAYLAIVAELESAIADGRLRPGDRLPTHRLLADLLGLNVSTVTRAYREAERRHLIGGEVGRGTYVLGPAQAGSLFEIDRRELTTPDVPLDLSTNTPPPVPRRLDLAESIAALQENGELERLLDYPRAADWLLLRSAAAAWIGRRGLVADPERLLVTAGAQHALATILGWLADETGIAAEALTYPGLHMLARERGWRLSPLAMDEEGARPDAIEAACRAGRRLFVLSPSLQNPTGASMSAARRRAVADLLRQYDAFAVEEDVYGLLGDPDLPTLAGLAPENVAYVTGLSKTVAPGLRLGFLVLPPSMVSRIRDAEHQTRWYVSPLMASVARSWIANGTAAARLAWQRQELAARWRLVRRILPAGLYCGAPGPHLWLPIESAARARRLTELLEHDGVRVVTGETFALRKEASPAGIRLSLGAAPNRHLLTRALERIASWSITGK
jgi:DNA-binding transcriptional MocR family regulator